jgi:hypothetical protein
MLIPTGHLVAVFKADAAGDIAVQFNGIGVTG